MAKQCSSGSEGGRKEGKFTRNWDGEGMGEGGRVEGERVGMGDGGVAKYLDNRCKIWLKMFACRPGKPVQMKFSTMK